MPDTNEAVEATLERANRLFASGMGNTLGILKAADADLSKRLHGLVKKKGTADLKFTAAQALLYRQQIRLTQDYLDKRLLGHTHTQALKAVASGVKTTTALAKKLEKRFTGIAKPLQLESQQQQDSIVKGTGSSLLRQHVTSVARYSTAMIGDFERVMRVASLQGMTQAQTISKLVAQGELGGINAAKLNQAEPGYFPKPSGYVTRRYWAERIARTETAYAYNAANLSTIATAKVVDFPDMQKKILAHFDQRTAPDSIAVHGQIRPVDGLFTDGAGRMYKHPPARPNDRETVIPWRPHWTELPATNPAPPEAIAAAQVEAQPAGLASAETGQKHVPPSKELIRGLVEKAKAEQVDVAKTTAKADVSARAQVVAQRTATRGKEVLGSVRVVDDTALAKAQALQQAKGVKLKGQDPAVVKAKAELRAAELRARVEQKQAAHLAKLEASARVKAMRDAKQEAELKAKAAPAPAPTPAVKLDAAAHLRGEAVEKASVQSLGGGVNESKLLTWEEGGKTRKAVWKPAEGEAGGARDGITGGTYYRREAAMYELDALMGGATVVPPTVARKLNGAAGSLQEFVDGARVALEAKGSLTSATVLTSTAKRMTLLDLVAANTDRHSGNWMVRETGEAIAIDNGLAFPRGKPDSFVIARVGPHNEEAQLSLDAEQQALLGKLKPRDVARVLAKEGIEAQAIAGTLGRMVSLQNNPTGPLQTLKSLQPARVYVGEADREWADIPLQPQQRAMGLKIWAMRDWQSSLKPGELEELQKIAEEATK